MQLRIRAEGFDAVLRMVARGAGLALVPLAALQRNLHLALQSRPLNEAWARRRLLLCARDFDALPLYAQGLCRALLEP
jgi:DNA-binding transcriptional LysR family regulator